MYRITSEPGSRCLASLLVGRGSVSVRGDSVSVRGDRGEGIAKGNKF